ncbi:MAG: class IV adenylate cyclase [Gemmataceae bacterium]|nr:class IV adenylate cyclase [Gemmataceae bacterium]MDW8265184.1 class IV adenylate cyclase [Gemmataceae bacterium]
MNGDDLLEVEMKFPVQNLGELERRLQAWGVALTPPQEEVDRYFNAPDRDFARTDEALRLRRVGSAQIVTYKGPKLSPTCKTRVEIEVPLAHEPAAAEAFARLLEHLGYRPTGLVRKWRRTGRLHRDGYSLDVCLDVVDGLGSFAELEIVAARSEQDRAAATLRAVARDLGLEGSERRSYLELLLEQAALAEGGRT